MDPLIVVPMTEYSIFPMFLVRSFIPCYPDVQFWEGRTSKVQVGVTGDIQGVYRVYKV